MLIEVKLGEVELGRCSEREAVEKLVVAHRDGIEGALMKAINSDLLILKTLNLFGVEELYVAYVDSIDLPETKAWSRIRERMRGH